MQSPLLCIFFIFQISCLGAQNIVLNPGFEYTSPYWGQILSVDWYSGSGTCQEGDYFPASGDGLVGIRFYHETSWEDEKNWQEYIFQNIEGKLIAGETYKVSFKYRLADRCIKTTDAMGIAFFENTNGTLTQETIRNANPQVKNTSGNYLSNYESYNTFTGYYTASGEEDYFALGAFKMDHNMTRVAIDNNTSLPIEEILFYFDDISITQCIGYPDIEFQDQIVLCQSEDFVLDVNIPDADNYSWSTGDTTQSIVVGAQPQDYWVEVTKNGCTNKDTTKIRIFSGPFDLGSDQTVCSETDLPVTLIVDKNQQETVLWEDGSYESKRLIKKPGTYTVTKSYDHCSYSDTITFTDFSSEIFIYPNPTNDIIKIGPEKDVVIEGLYTQDGKALVDFNIPIDELNEIISQALPSTYFLRVNYRGCRQVLQFSKTP